MPPWIKELPAKLEKQIFVILNITILISLLTSTPKPVKTLNRNNKPCCLKGYICKAVMSINK